MDSNKPQSTLSHFVDFLREHLLVALVTGAVPVLLRRWFAPPAGYEVLEYISLLICVLVSGIAYSLRENIANAISDLRPGVRMLPAVGATVLSIFAVCLTISYLDPSSPVDRVRAYLYISLWPLYVTAFTVLLIILFYQHEQRFVIRNLLARLGPDHDSVVSRLQKHVCYNEIAAENPVYGAIGSCILKRQDEQLDHLSRGRIEISPSEMIPTIYKACQFSQKV